ncbi:MAG TPA: DUF481 domain-containing protein [Candidatus Aminicenantes bacterium]|nr:DUF481 domain-containing protein [Candidatus Aminicenantes bacterium]
MNRKAAVPVIGFTLLLASFSFAREKPAEVPPWKGDIALSLSLSRGNARSMNFGFTFAADGPVGRNLTLENKGVYLFGEVDSATSVESAQVSSRLGWKHSSRVFSFYELQAVRNRFKNYSYRFMPAAGFGYKAVDQKNLVIALDAGVSGVASRYYDTGDTASFAGLKLGESLVWKISETAEFNEKLEINSDISRMSRYFFRLETNLVTALAKSWAVKLTFINYYENRPVGLGIKKNDITLITGISRKF